MLTGPRPCITICYFFALCRGRLTGRSGNLPNLLTASQTLIVVIFGPCSKCSFTICLNKSSMEQQEPVNVPLHIFHVNP